jgi:hypothetical protein
MGERISDFRPDSYRVRIYLIQDSYRDEGERKIDKERGNNYLPLATGITFGLPILFNAKCVEAVTF